MEQYIDNIEKEPATEEKPVSVDEKLGFIRTELNSLNEKLFDLLVKIEKIEIFLEQKGKEEVGVQETVQKKLTLPIKKEYRR